MLCFIPHLPATTHSLSSCSHQDVRPGKTAADALLLSSYNSDAESQRKSDGWQNWNYGFLGHKQPATFLPWYYVNVYNMEAVCAEGQCIPKAQRAFSTVSGLSKEYTRLRRDSVELVSEDQG